MVLQFVTADRSSLCKKGTTMPFFQSLGDWYFLIIFQVVQLSHTHRYLLPVGACIAVTIGEHTSTVGSDKRCTSNKIMTLYMLYPQTCAVVKVKTVEVCRCPAWRRMAEVMYDVRTLTLLHEMQTSDQLRAPSALSPGKLSSLASGGESIDIVDEVLTCHPHVSECSNF